MNKFFNLLLLLVLSAFASRGQNCTVNAGGNQDICLGASFNLSGAIGGPFNGSSVQWSIISQPAGAANTIPNPNSFSTSAGIATVAGTYVFRLTATCGDGITNFNDVTYTVSAVPATPAQSGTASFSCYSGAPISISGTAPLAGETVSWSVANGSGSFSAPNASTTTFTPNFPLDECSGTHTVQIVYTKRNAAGCERSVTRSYSFSRAYTFAATAEPLNVCGSQTKLKGSCPGAGAALWTVTGTPPGAPAPNIIAPNSRETNVTNLVPGNYVFNYTVSGSCNNGSTNVNVFVASGGAVSMANAGVDQHFCSAPGSVSLSGNQPAVGETGTWALLSGGTSVTIASPNNPNTTASGLTAAGAPYRFTYTLSTPGGCSNVDTMIVSVERPLVLSGLNHTDACGFLYPPGTGGTGGGYNRAARLGNFAFNEIDTLTVSVTYLSGPVDTLSNYTAVGTAVNPNITSNMPDSEIPLGQTVTTKFWNTGDINADNELYLPFSSSDDRKNISYYVVNNINPTLVGVYHYVVTYQTKCSTYVANVKVERGVTTTVNAGSDVALACGASSATLAGNIIDQFATWSTVSMPSGATDPINLSNRDLRFPSLSGLINGTYIFRYANKAGSSCAQAFDEVKLVVSNTAPPIPNAGANATVCAGSYMLNGSAIPATALGKWRLISPAGSPVTFSDSTIANPVVSGMLPGTTYTFRYIYENGCGTNFDDVVITTNTSTAPAKPNISITGGNCSATSIASFPSSLSQTITHPALLAGESGTLTLVANPASALSSWSETGNTATSKTVSVNLNSAAAISYIWCVSSATCAAQTFCDTVTRYYMATSTAFTAGPNQNLCSVTAFPYNAVLAGTSTNIPKQWSLIYSSNGQNVTFGNATSNTTSVALPAAGTYTFKYELVSADPSCQTRVDYVTIEASSPGSFANAGPDISFCNTTGTTNLNAVPLATGTGRWEVVSILNGAQPSIADLTSANTAITFTQSGIVTLKWSSFGTNPACGASSSDLVTVNYIAPANAGADIELCNHTSANLNAINPAPAEGTWSQISGPNTANISDNNNPEALITGLVTGVYTFQWEVQKDGICVTTDEVTVTINNATLASNAGTDFTTCNGSAGNTIALDATPAPTGLSGTWAVTRIPAGATAGTFSNLNDPSATYSGAVVPGAYSFSWTVTDGACSLTDMVNVTVDPSICLNISGTIFNDSNSNTIIDLAEAGAATPAGLYIYLVNDNGIIVDSAMVATNGTYTLTANPGTSYNIYLSPVSYPVGTRTATTPINTTPPNGWEHTGENGAGNTGPGDGNPDGVLAVNVGTTDVSQQNFGIKESNPLPVTLLSFKAIKSGADAVLQWITVKEENNAGFVVENGKDGAQWLPLGFVPAQKAAGNSTGKVYYDFKHIEPGTGKQYYRLKQIDADGQVHYSSISILNFDVEQALHVYPNPAKANITITGLKGYDKLCIYEMTGRLVKTIHLNDQDVLEIDLSTYSSGVYNLKVSDKQGLMQTFRIVKD